MRELPGRENRGVDRTPVTFLETATLHRGSPDIVFLEGHRVRLPGAEDGFQRCTKVAGAVGGGVVRIVGENLEQVPSDDPFPAGHRGGQIGVADGHDAVVALQNQVRPRRRLKEHLEVERSCTGHIRKCIDAKAVWIDGTDSEHRSRDENQILWTHTGADDRGGVGSCAELVRRFRSGDPLPASQATTRSPP